MGGNISLVKEPEQKIQLQLSNFVHKQNELGRIVAYAKPAESWGKDLLFESLI